MKPLALALGGSLVLHLAAVAAFRSGEPKPSPAPKVEKRGDGFVSFTAVSLAEKPAAQPQPQPTAVAKAPVRSVKPVEAAALEALEPAASPGVEGGTEPASAGEPSGPTAEVAPPSVGGTGSEPAGSAAPEDALMALVHARLAAATDRCYPAAALRFQQRGTVQLSFCVDAQGGTTSTSVTQSSGAQLLDAAARGCVLENAAPFPREATARCFSVPVRFGLGP